MLHTTSTQQCLREAWRVLKPNGQARVMVYHNPSLTGFMLWMRYGIWRGNSVREVVYDHLESPGTKSFTQAEVRGMMCDFEELQFQQVFRSEERRVGKECRSW